MALERFANTPTPAAPSTPWTTLNGAITSGALSLTVTSASAFPSLAQFRVLIDSEWMLVTAGAGTTTWTVTRGVEGSTPTAHADGASIFHVLTAAALLRNPRSMTTLGDMEYMAADLGPARLAAPSDGDYVTRWTSGVPSWVAAAGGGGVTSVALTMPNVFAVAGSPITTSGTLAVSLATQSANQVWAGPTNGVAAAPTFRGLVAADIPDLSATYQTKVLSVGVDGSVLFRKADNTIEGSATLIYDPPTVGLGILSIPIASLDAELQGYYFDEAASYVVVTDCGADDAPWIGQLTLAQQVNDNASVVGGYSVTKIRQGTVGITGGTLIGYAADCYIDTPNNNPSVQVAFEGNAFISGSSASSKFACYYAGFTHSGPAAFGRATAFYAPVPANLGGGTIDEYVALKVSDFSGVAGVTGMVIEYGTKFIVNSAGRISAAAGATLQGSLLFTDNTFDIGASGATRPRSIYPGTSILNVSGAAATPSYSFASFNTTGFYAGSATSIRVAHNGSQTGTIGSAGWDILSSGAEFGFGTDAGGVKVRRNGSHLLEFIGRTTTNAQTVRIYGSYTDDSNFVRGALVASATAIELAFQTAGTGADDGDVILTPTGTGRVRFGTHNAIGAEAITGYIEIKDAGGTVRKIAVVS